MSDFRQRSTRPFRAPQAVQEVAARTRSLGVTSGHLCLYAGLTFPAAAPTLDPANLWIHPSLDFDRNLSASHADCDAPFPFLYISFPSAKDPSFSARYPHRHTIGGCPERC